jgi:RNA polymerase sigma factor (sigma-70 family)
MESTNPDDFDIVDIYYNALSKVRILSKQEEKDLLIEYKSSSNVARKITIRQRVSESNLRLVFGFAKKFWDQKDPTKLQELIAQGNVGLLLALDKFDPKYNVRFCTYAGHWVLMAMRKAHIGLVKTPAGKSVILEEETKIPERPYIQDYTSNIHNIQHKHILHTWLRFLSERERYIILNSFSLVKKTGEPKSLRTMAGVLGLSSERVRQLKAQALSKLSLWLTYHITPRDL